jgi:hypothetical protein
MKICIALFPYERDNLCSATVAWRMTVDRSPRLIDVRQIGPNSERDISGRCSACGVILIARLDHGENPAPGLLRNKLDKLFERHLTEVGCGKKLRTLVPE